MEINYIKEAVIATVNKWDFTNGTITQKSVTDKLGMSLHNVRYEWCHVKDMAIEKNRKFKIERLLKSNK